MPKTPFEIWNDIPDEDARDRANKEKWYSELELKEATEKAKKDELKRVIYVLNKASCKGMIRILKR